MLKCQFSQHKLMVLVPMTNFLIHDSLNFFFLTHLLFEHPGFIHPASDPEETGLPTWQWPV